MRQIKHDISAAPQDRLIQDGGTHHAIHIIISIYSDHLPFLYRLCDQGNAFQQVFHFCRVPKGSLSSIQKILSFLSGEQPSVGKNCRRRLTDPQFLCHCSRIHFCTFQKPAFHRAPPFHTIPNHTTKMDFIKEKSIILGDIPQNNAVPYLSYCNSLVFFDIRLYHTGPEIQMEEYAPAMIPIIIGSANSLIEGTPIT